MRGGGGGRKIVLSSTAGMGTKQKGDTKEGKEEKEEAPINVLNRETAMKEVLAKEIAKSKE